MDFSRSGKLTDNPFVESFNGSLRDECHWAMHRTNSKTGVGNIIVKEHIHP